ncbi:hypothetical protein [Cerasicoccus arenae]|uniref:hypothetical protein n=1 Tax=Cerasicoccus arenae TaxID=424488 RepID=UPI0016753277|nr:hypothetical protein [Cerasicoccus arenae]MBK1859157.1 hypothetical protein [Cerasicoccus arenae]
MKQEPGPGSRRWWDGDGLEFVVWYDGADNFTGFQLCYRGCALTWKTTGYWSHVRVGSGISQVDSRGYSSPILQANGAPTRPPFKLLTDFERSSKASVGDQIRDLVTGVLSIVAR